MGSWKLTQPIALPTVCTAMGLPNRRGGRGERALHQSRPSAFRVARVVSRLLMDEYGTDSAGADADGWKEGRKEGRKELPRD